MKYKYGWCKPTKYEQSLNGNIQHTMKQIHVLKVPQDLLSQFIQQLRLKYQQEMSTYFIRQVLNEYFVNTYCPLDTLSESSLV